jgi:dihydrofolate reductase
MSDVRCQISVSLDGFVAGPNQSHDNPIGEGGMRLHDWAFRTDSWRAQQGLDGGEHNADADVIADASQGVGAYIMGRKMFGGGEGEWDESWIGWWGEDPPFRVPVFVLSHHSREPLAMQGGTTFTFVTDGIESALDQARKAAGDRDVAIAGGAATVNQYLAAGLVDELRTHIAPVTLGAGERLFDGVPPLHLELLTVRAGSIVTHISYRVLH